jgi:hypothetical protein
VVGLPFVDVFVVVLFLKQHISCELFLHD